MGLGQRGRRRWGCVARDFPYLLRPVSIRKFQSDINEKAIAEVKAVYAELSQRSVERNCELRTGCCQFKLTGKTPYLTKGEALVAAKAVRAAGRKVLPERNDGACPLLHPRTSRCMIYQDRPFGCRTHFCEAAGGDYARKDVVDLIHRLELVDDDLVGKGAQRLTIAVEEALRDLV